jgi:hypothetical protein
MLVFQSDRQFALASYVASHGLLLFSSRKSKDRPTRVDLLFQDVRAMELRNWFQGLSVYKVDDTYLEGARSAPQSLIEPGNVVYALRGDDWEGYIVGGVVRWLEWEGDDMERSPLLGDPLQ